MKRRWEETGNYLDDSFKVKEGPFTTYYPNGQIKDICNYHNDKLLGLDREYSEKGTLSDSTLYINDIPCRFAYRWRADGTCIGKGVFDDSGKGREWLYWGKDSLMDYKVYSTGHKRDSVWTYYYKDGKISCREFYNNGDLQNRMCYDEYGKVQNKCDSQVMPKPLVDINTYLANHLSFPHQYAPDKPVKVIAKFVVDEDGHISDVEIVKKVNPTFDAIVKRGVQKMPKWVPGMDHNRKVRVYFTIPVSFELEQ